MQFGKLFVVFGRQNGEEKAVYCTGSMTNTLDTAVVNC
jgi:hypothetical protein